MKSMLPVGLFRLPILGVLLAAGGPAAHGATEVTYVANVENQTQPRVRYTSEPWQPNEGGFLEGRGRGHRLLCDPAPGAGDFRLEMDLSLATAGRESYFVIGNGNTLTMSTGDRPWRIRGRFFRATEGERAIPAPNVRPGQLFNLTLAREGDILRVLVDGREIHRGKCSTAALDGAGLDPGTGVVRLQVLRGLGEIAAEAKGRRHFDNPFGLQLRPRPQSMAEVRAPVIVADAPSNECSTVARRDGAIEIYYITKPESDSVSYIRSEDGGLTWGEPIRAFALPGVAYYAIKVIETGDGDLQAVFHIRGEGEGGYRGRLYEVYHARWDAGTKTWSEPRRIVPGYVGSIRGMTELKDSGRLILTVARAQPARAYAPENGPDFGWHNTYAYLSDDEGRTWRASPDELKVELLTPNNTRYGAVEPVVLELKDGRVWMLVRDRQGRLLQSFSTDRGEHWAPLARSPFISSDSPAELLRLRDGRIVLLVSGCQFWSDPRSYAMGGREVLQAAISSDEGRTWSGFREVLHETNQVSGGDRGTAYPSAAENRDGKVVIMSGQGEGKRAIVLLDPDWLTETAQRDELDADPVYWTQYGDEGLRVENENGRPVVAIPVKSALPCGASWNFPAAREGQVKFRVRVPATARDVKFMLNDHFTRADDAAAGAHAVFTVDYSPTDERWHVVRLSWSNAATGGTVRWEIDGKEAGQRRANRPAELGLNYLRVEFHGNAEEGALQLGDLAMRQTSAGEMISLERRPGSAAGGAVLGVGAAGAFDANWTNGPSIIDERGERRMYYSATFAPETGPMAIGLAVRDGAGNWRRHADGKPVFGPGAAGAFDAAGVFGPEVLHDGERFLMWYTGTAGPRHASGFHEYRIGVASSRDGIHWARENGGRPVIDLGAADAPDAVQAATPSVLREGKGFRMWYAAWARAPNHTICTAVSEDGINWRKENGGRSVEGLDPGTAFGHAVCRIPDGYLMLYMALAPNRGLYAAKSKDGLRWSMLNGGEPVLRATGEGFDADVVGHPFVEYSDGKLRVWYSGYQTKGRRLPDWILSIGLAEGRWP